jgi:hypothetical protein
LSTDQLIQLAKEILKPNELRHVDWLMRAHTIGSTPNWNRQNLIEYIASCNNGTDPDQIVRNRDAAMPAFHGHDDDSLYEAQCPKELLPRPPIKRRTRRRSRCKRVQIRVLKVCCR